MDDLLLENAAVIRMGVFVGIFATMALWEIVREKRHLRTSKKSRWLANILIIIADSVIVRLLFPMGAVGIAFLAGEYGWGLFNVVDVPFWAAIVVSVIALDFVVWLQHVMFHAVPALWKLHMMHHADLDFDVTTGTRFHPIEMLLSLGIKAAAIALLGPPVVAVLLFEVILNATSMFNHANINIPEPIDRVLRLFLVTPDMHRVHHSVEPHETNTNFGFSLPWWDRLFGTYKPQPEAGHEDMEIGLKQFRDPAKNTFLHLMILPFVDPAGDYDISHREIDEPTAPTEEKRNGSL
ncbi:MAG: sterol desaturase family protein [Persicimonas sp.]